MYTANIEWKRNGQAFTDKRYSREHTWRFDGGAVVMASSSPAAVPPPLSNPAGVDPEEAVVAAAASCHMMWFLALAANEGFIVDSYRDEPRGVMERPAGGEPWLARIEMRPRVEWSGPNLPTPEQVSRLHEIAHKKCYIANSLKSDVRILG